MCYAKGCTKSDDDMINCIGKHSEHYILDNSREIFLVEKGIIM